MWTNSTGQPIRVRAAKWLQVKEETCKRVPEGQESRLRVRGSCFDEFHGMGPFEKERKLIKTMKNCEDSVNSEYEV